MREYSYSGYLNIKNKPSFFLGGFGSEALPVLEGEELEFCWLVTLVLGSQVFTSTRGRPAISTRTGVRAGFQRKEEHKTEEGCA